MLTLKPSKDGLGITTGQSRVQLVGSEIQLDDLTFSEPGEYEKAGVEVVYGDAAALIIWEHMELVYIFKGEKPSGFEKSQFAPCDVVIVNETLDGVEKATFNEWLEVYDPRVVITKVAAGTAEATDSYKLSRQSLPEEGRQFVALA